MNSLDPSQEKTCHQQHVSHAFFPKLKSHTRTTIIANTPPSQSRTMFKTKLQEYCQSKSWLLPSYGVTREGADHCPRFKAVVQVNGSDFATPDFCRTSKEAQNLAAKLAFEHFSGSVPETQQTSPIATCNGANRVASDNSLLKDGLHMCKNQLQIYAQKRNLELPVYSVERVGPCHSSRFKCRVTVEDKTYESEDYFNTVKEAETSAAKVALASIFPSGFEEDDPSIYKNLLQEFLQKEMSCLPKYATTVEGPSHMPEFVSALEIQGENFRGQVAKNKKQAEMNVAKVAYTALRERKCKQDDRVNGGDAHVKKSLQFPSTPVPDSGSDLQPILDKQEEVNEDRSPGAAPNSSTEIPDGIQGLKIEQSTEVPITWSEIASSSPGNGSSDKEKVKKKIRVLPRSSTRSYPNALVRHKDEKWIAYNTR